MGHWNLIEIEYEDRASKQLEEGNAVVFEVDTVVEQIKGLGNRRYSYKAQGSTLTLDMGGLSVKWEIDSLEASAMDIATPIGTYKLVR